MMWISSQTWQKYIRSTQYSTGNKFQLQMFTELTARTKGENNYYNLRELIITTAHGT